jgi:superfamily II DNA or RNA helicase
MNAAAQGDAFPFDQPLPTEPAPINWLDVLPPEADCLRDYQVAQVEKIPRAMRAGYRRILVQLPTGGGKTHEIAAVVAAAVLAGLAVLIIGSRSRLVRHLLVRL